MTTRTARGPAALLVSAALMTGFASLAAAPASAAPASVQAYSCSTTYYSGTAITEKGDTGNRVIEVQCQLHHRGYLSAGQVDGVFGSQTYNAVLDFQSDYRRICHQNLSLDGVVGEYTWAALRSACPA